MSARIRTGYSFRHAAGKIDDVMKVLRRMGYLRAPITDTASTYGWVRWDAAAREHGLRPVFGVELGVARDITAKRPSVDYWTFVARDSLVPLHGLIGVATEQFRYEPLLTIEQATSAASVVNVIMGHRAPAVDIMPQPGLWFGVGPATTYHQLVLAADHPCVAVCDNRFPTKHDRALYELVCGRHARTQSYPQWILDDHDLQRLYRELEADLDLPYAAIENRNLIWQQSTATLQRGEMARSSRPASLIAMCMEGAQRLDLDLLAPVYSERILHEIEVIQAKGFEDYFYLVTDLVTWARERMLVGPARGSSCGSLVCYLLGITTIDPIEHGLLFERFIDINRPDLPDIDIDFSDQHRELVFDYVRTKYGPHRVARLGTVNMFQARSALKEVALALDLPVWTAAAAADQAERATLASVIKPDHSLALALELEDHPRHAGQHAAGIVITQGSVTDVVAVDRRTGATMCDKYDAEVLNLLKIDALGLTQLSIFEDALELAGLARGKLQSVRLDDVKAFHVLNVRKFAGVFQFNGPALQGLCTKVTVTSLEDLVTLTALARPGPLDSGEAKRWIGIKTGLHKPSYPHPLFEQCLKPTFGVVVYQEQVMQIARAVGMSWEEVSALRRLISKSAGPEALERYHDSFIDHGTASGVPENILQDVWGILRASGAYSFNKSHAVAYAVISYWCCWLKAYYPLEYAAACLTHAGEEMQLKLLRELTSEGTHYVAADPKRSIDKWTVAIVDGLKTLIGPLRNIIGIGPKHEATILSQRARPHERLPESVGKLLANCKTKLDDLWPVKSAIERLMTDELRADLVSPRLDIIDVQPNGSDRTVRVEGLIDDLRKVNENSAERKARRQGVEVFGPSTSLNLWINDDTDRIFAKIDRHAFEELGKEGLLKHGKGYYSLRGSVPPDFRMIRVEKFRFIGQDGATDDKNIEPE